MKTKKETPGGQAGGIGKSQFDKQDDTKNADQAQEEAEVLADLSALIRERYETALADVSAWNHRVEVWRAKHGPKPIPVKAFKEHPASDMLLLLALGEDCDWIDESAMRGLVSKALASSNRDLRRSIPFMKRATAAMFETATRAANPAGMMARAVFNCGITNMLGMLIELRTATDFYGLEPDKVAGCILVRTADVQEGEGDD
ncbi:hypothetical protein [Pseudoblastomonas halimionae]|uniref:Uncharacterized protein n=1 Tax=Alteriqipengyuania halimionae TaxID=1926630 RepID=A0A6I4U2S4_9SPHN|nr:hypothetical protein [Alteriqipengyuania halimionae]MXP09604.1 hypothetical protein [Alteriqipengyuania halimionae]